jgi:HAD superfamily hydrolase (TIGR01509 family)
MPTRALLLDFDGVIADTENVHVAAWQRTFAAMGWEVADEVCARAMEIDDRAFLAEVFDQRKILHGNIDGWVGRKQELTLSLLTDSPRVYPGVAELIERVKGLGTVKLAAVSTTWRANIVTVLKAANLYSAFSLIVGKEDVKAAKPDPEGYTLAVGSLGLRPRDTVALEDSATGLSAARGAGVRAVAVGHRKAFGPWVGTHEFLDDLRRTDLVLAKIGLATGK